MSRVRVVRVAFDEQIFAIQRYGGISRVFAELAHQFIANPELGVELQPVAAPLVNEYILKDPITAKALNVWPSRHWVPSIARSLFRRRHKGPADVVHNTFYLPRALSDYPGAKRVVTVHDMIPELFPQTRRRLDFVTVKRRYVEKADHIVCVSESTKLDLERIYGPCSAPISVIHSGVGPEFSPLAPPIPKWPSDYLLHVGHRSGYKGGHTLFGAFTKIQRDFPDTTLVLAGGGPLSTEEHRALRGMGIDQHVFQQQVPEALMPSAYAHARALVFPSEYEGFGLPVLEAMASGTPTILCASSALIEVGGDCAKYFPPSDPDSLADRIADLLTDESEVARMREAGMSHARNFSWTRTARELQAVYAAVSQ